jgi:hypothetical protein
MSCSIPVLNINIEDCVGDSLGKHNYNALTLDTSVCNLSGLLSNASTVLNQLSSTIQSYQPLISTYNDSKINSILETFTTVNLLSSFWNNYEFSIEYPINSYPTQGLSLISPTLSTVNSQTINDIVDSKLQNLASSYLNKEYSAINFPNNTVINVIFFLYNVTPSINSSNINDYLTNINSVNVLGKNVRNFNYYDRFLFVNFNRNTIGFSTGVILKYYVNNNIWNYYGYITDDVINNTAILPSLPTVTNTQSVSCSPLKNNKYYRIYDYTDAVCHVTGTNKTGDKAVATLIIINGSQRQVQKFTYKASGYNSATNKGGTDVWLEFDSTNNVIRAYEENPTPKTLVKTWNFDWESQKATNFRYISNHPYRTNICGYQYIHIL